MGVVRTAECERARSWVSLGLDGELSEIELALLCAHIVRCTACAGFEHDADALTRELRAAPLERPAVASMLPRRRSAAMRSLQISAAAAAVALAAGLGSLAGSLHSHSTPTSGAVASVPDQRVPAGRLIAL